MCFQGLELLENIREVDILDATRKQHIEVMSPLDHIIVLCFFLIFNIKIGRKTQDLQPCYNIYELCMSNGLDTF